MNEITLNKAESIQILKSLSQIEGVLFTLSGVPDAAFCAVEEACEIVESKLREDIPPAKAVL